MDLKTSTEQEVVGWIFDIQRYSVHDGPGIRTLVFLKGCPLRCPWCANPESQLPGPELRFVESLCKKCKLCVEACPVRAIEEKDGAMIFNRDVCTTCGKCSDVCPAKAISVIGERKTVGEIMEVLEKDRVFFENSGGGITLSGGEPLVQPKFAASIMRRSKEKGFHTAIETSGYQEWNLAKPVFVDVDLVLFDVKFMDPVRHKRIVGVSNELILSNATKIAEMRKQMIIRVPVIPGYNDDLENLDQTLSFAESIGVSEVHLLPYHRLGQHKYQQLGRVYRLASTQPPNKEYMESLIEKIQRPGIRLRVGG